MYMALPPQSTAWPYRFGWFHVRVANRIIYRLDDTGGQRWLTNQLSHIYDFTTLPHRHLTWEGVIPTLSTLFTSFPPNRSFFSLLVCQTKLEQATVETQCDLET